MRWPLAGARSGAGRLAPVVARVGLAVVGVMIATSCGWSGLAFRTDDRLDVLGPADRSTVPLPVTLRWKDAAQPPAFLVVFDQSPPRPGRSPGSLFSSDRTCRRDKALCETAGFLEAHNVFITKATTLTVDALHDFGRNGRPDEHEAIVVRLDERGHRSGEIGARVQFKIRRTTR